MAEVQDIPRYPTGQFVELRWASDAGTQVEPASGNKDLGWSSAEIVTRQKLNWVEGKPMEFIMALISRTPNASEGLFSSWFPPVDCGIWADTGINPLDVYLTDSGGVDSIVADVWVDPESVGAVRVQVSVPLGDPQTLQASRDTYVFVPAEMIAPPLLTRAEVTFGDVPIGDPAPATPAGTVAVWRIETDGSGIVDQEILLPAIPVFRAVGALSLGTVGALTVGGNAQVSGTLGVDGAVAFDDDLTVAGETALGLASCTSMEVDTFVVVGTTLAVAGDANLGTGAGNAVVTIGADASDTLNVAAQSVFNELATFGSVDAVDLNAIGDVNIGTGVGNKTVVVGSNASDTLTVEAATTFNAAVIIDGGAGSSLSSDPTAICEWNGQMEVAGRMTLFAGASVAPGDLSNDGNHNLRWRDSASTKYILVNPSGWVKGHGQVSTAGAAALTLSVDTDTAVAPIANADLDISATAWVSRAVAGTVEVSLVEVGVGVIGTVGNINVVATAADTFTPISFSRTHSASTTPRIYRFTVDGGASNVTVTNVRITVTPTS